MTRCILALVVLLAPFAAMAAIPEAEAPIEATVSVDHKAEWAAHLTQQRTLGLERLAAYTQAGIFPDAPVGPTGIVHQFLDAQGRPCAVAYLIAQSGHQDLVEATAATRNDVVLSEVASGPLADWMLTSGFTREEIAVIQVPGWREEARQMFAPPELPNLAEARRIQTHLLSAHQLLSGDSAVSIDKALSRIDTRRPVPQS